MISSALSQNTTAPGTIYVVIAGCLAYESPLTTNQYETRIAATFGQNGFVVPIKPTGSVSESLVQYFRGNAVK